MYREAVMGNWGGGAHRDGLDGVANPAANIGNAPCEVVERQAPLRIERYELVPDSGGAGQWRGGLAVMRQLRYLGERATLQLRSDRRHHRPFGVHGGLPGAASTNLLLDDGREEQWPTKFVRPLLRDQAIRHVTAEAGGYGDPLLRDPARVLDDVRNGKVSVQAAERDYGVRVSGPPWCVEEPATRALRAARASSPDTATPPPNGVIGVGTRCQAHERDSLERLCRYIARPAVSNERLSVNDRGQVVYRLKHSFHDGTTHVVLDPMDFMRHIRVPHPFGAASGCANRQSCRFGIARLAAPEVPLA